MNKRLTVVVLLVGICTAGLFIFKPGIFKKDVPDEAIEMLQGVNTERKEAGFPPLPSLDSLWYKQAIIYSLDVKVFSDSDGDGIGDFNGLTQRLPYIKSLGVNAVWLAPFQPSPWRDDGYDVKDYYSVEPRMGSIDDFRRFVQQAKRDSIRVIMDLVVNHSSIEHSWFVQSRDTTNTYHTWYSWSRTKPDNFDKGMAFPGVQKSIWTYDSLAKAYYYHRFYEFQPDLDLQQPAVRSEVKKMLSFWLAEGVDGFRLDAVPFAIEVPDTKGDNFKGNYDIIKEMRRHVQSIAPSAVLLGEANITPGENTHYFGEHGEGLHLMFNFHVNQLLFYALAAGEVAHLQKALSATGGMPHHSQWAQFLRNHDEVDLGRLTKKERSRVYEAFGPLPSMQLYDRGIRRRLAPMLNNDQKRLKLAYSLLFSLPSTPVIRYGDEIGMGDNLALAERLAVRTPMQWNDSVNAGFSTSKSPLRPVIDTGAANYRMRNVVAEERDPNSLLQFTRRLIAMRRACPEMNWGRWEVVETGSGHVTGMIYRWNNSEVLILNNLSASEQQLHLQQLVATDKKWTALNGGPIPQEGKMKAAGYESYWYRLK
ncbi:alpha-amylase family protein [Chitinophaga horti]|uniref:Alpha-amylase family protein n=1 Tax=Chitinophaga horti TaxID=2920382 RepID=A0ABY6IV21_9BACT|nr:alpha-amylase family protein [Chitinophaga horti]UYQ91219.1 alpha-amylase family protein [Chitinophaga horti]